MNALELELIEKGVIQAPKITWEDVEDNIKEVYYFNAYDAVYGTEDRDQTHPLSVLTFCVIVLQNGYTVTGESACVSHENFDADTGRCLARQNALEKVWPLMGYVLKEALKNG